MQLAAQTVFLPRHHTLFIEEWLVYHMLMGVDHFYLYDNTGSMDCNPDIGMHPNLDKRGYDLYELTSHLTDDDIQQFLNELTCKYDGMITFVKWQYRDKNHKIIYAQNKAIRDCIDKYSKLIDWLYIVDMDELFYSPQKLDIKQCIDYCENNKVSKINLREFNFLSRYKLNSVSKASPREKYFSQIFYTTNHVNRKGGYSSGKQIIKVKDLAPQAKWRHPLVHELPLARGCKNICDGSFARFNHYRTTIRDLDSPKMKVRYPAGLEDLNIDDSLKYLNQQFEDVHMLAENYLQ